MLVLSREEVERLLDLDELRETVAAAMADLSAGRASMPPRVAALTPQGLLAAMPAFLPSAEALTTKLVSLFPHNRDRPTHQAVICCFDPENGTPLALLDGTLITAARTAAGSAVAAQLLARGDASTVCIVGTGVQAEAHARAVARLPQVRALHIAGRDAGRAAALAEALRAELPCDVQAVDVEAGVREALIVCATTHAAAPVLQRSWLQPGAHVSSVGYNADGDGEIDSETVRDALVVVESRAAALAPPPSGAVELRRAIERGAITAEHVAVELGELVAGTAAGRTDAAQLTLYKSVGVAVQDAAAAALLLRRAREEGVGTQVAL